MFAKAKGPFARPSILSRFSRKPRDRDALQPLYRAVVARARDPFWYRDGGVPDTIDGRFDMVAAFMAMLIVRLDREGSDEAKWQAVMLTELFVEDMDESLHQIGIGDYVVGKHVGGMMGALGGRIGAVREAAEQRDFARAVRRNIFRDAPPSEEKVAAVAERLGRFEAALRDLPAATLAEGSLPAL